MRRDVEKGGEYEDLYREEREETYPMCYKAHPFCPLYLRHLSLLIIESDNEVKEVAFPQVVWRHLLKVTPRHRHPENNRSKVRGH